MMWAYLILINAACFLLMLSDKLRAKKQCWRIPEKTLITVAAIGGSMGGMLGMYLFRHKTRHKAFSIGFPLLAIIQLLTAITLYTLI